MLQHIFKQIEVDKILEINNDPSLWKSKIYPKFDDVKKWFKHNPNKLEKVSIESISINDNKKVTFQLIKSKSNAQIKKKKHMHKLQHQ